MNNPMKNIDPDGPLNFSIHDFKKWMMENATNEFNLQPQKKGIGVEVEPRVSLKRLVARMQPEDGDAILMAHEFKDNGGKVVEIDGSLYMIEVANGSFIIPRACVRRRDN
jgi:hypothetical protein